MAAGIIYIILGIIFLFCGILILKFKIVNILAGYDEKKVNNKEKLAKWFGTIVLIISLFTIIIGIITIIIDTENAMIVSSVLFMMITMVGAGFLVGGSQKYYDN